MVPICTTGSCLALCFPELVGAGWLFLIQVYLQEACATDVRILEPDREQGWRLHSVQANGACCVLFSTRMDGGQDLCVTKGMGLLGSWCLHRAGKLMWVPDVS